MRTIMKNATKRRVSICLSLVLALGLSYTASLANPLKVAKAAD